MNMGDVQEVQLQIKETRGTSSCSPKDAVTQTPALSSSSSSSKFKLWLKVAVYTLFILVGQTVATLLSRFYYDKGGNSKWLCTIATSSGFLIIPALLLFSSPVPPNTPSLRKLAPLYISLGFLIAVDSLLYAYGILYLPVSTFSLVCATQLAFNAVFSYFLNAQKFTALIFNSVVLVTFSSALLGVSSDSDGTDGVPKDKYPLGFMLTLGASALFSLFLSLTQLTFQKVLKRQNFTVVLNMQLYIGLVATVVAIGGLFASGEWRGLRKEMKGFEKGEVAYVMTLVCIAICWQVCGIGNTGLTFAVSSLFSNMICSVGLPLVPVFAVVFFHDSMNGMKVMAMLIAIWGSISYVYQDYIDYSKAKDMKTIESLGSEMNEVLK